MIESKIQNSASPFPIDEKMIRNDDQLLKLDQAWRILNQNQELIRSADQKVYLLIVMSTLLVTYVSTNLEKIITLGTLQKICLVLFLIAASLFFHFALSTLLARSSGAKKITPSTTPLLIPHLIFFGDIAKRHIPEDYVSDFHLADLDQILDDVCYQNYHVAIIAKIKYKVYRNAWLALLVEVAMFLMLEFSKIF